MFGWGKKAKKESIALKKKERTTLHVSSKTKDMLKSLLELPVSSDWLSDDVIDKINRDSAVTAAIGRRKASTLKKEIAITCDNEEIKTNLEKIFHYDLLDSILDTPYQGFSTFELNWTYKDYLWYPELVERTYSDFILDNRVLKFNTDGMPQDIPPHKALHAVYKAKPKKPYGQPLYNPLFWLINFKNGSMEFWIDLLERFGTPWVIAKTDEDKNALADEIYNMLGGDGAVLNLEDELDIKTAEKSGNFKEMIEYLDDQIRELINGGNLTGQVKGGSQAAATVHDDIREDLARADENILNQVIRTTIEYFKEVNYFTGELSIELKDKDDPNIELATRDKTIFDMGFKPKKKYIEDTYNIEVDEIITESSQAYMNKFMVFSKTMPNDELDNQINKIDTSSLTFQEQIIKIIQESESYEEVQEKLLEVYPDVDTKDLEDLLYKNITNSEILARAEIEEENPDG
ncbi:phage portal protein family protein [Sulfurimonas sp.]